MPVINISREDILKSKVFDPGWYATEVIGVDEKESKAGDSTNYTVEFKVITGIYKDASLYRLFNTKGMGFAVPFLTALGVSIGDQGQSFELNATIGRRLKVHCSNRSYEGKTRNDVDDFAPIDADIPVN